MPTRLESLPLIDHHCHGVLGADLDRGAFEERLTEARDGQAPGVSVFDSQLGFALRRWCPPVLDLEPHADPDTYLERRAALGAAEVNRRFLEAAGLQALYVDTGHTPQAMLGPEELGRLARADAREIVRLERLAEETAADGVGAADFASEIRERLSARGAVGAKSIAAYRAGLELGGERPSGTEVAAAAGRLMRAARPRVDDEVLHRFLIWCAVDAGLPVQFHVGYGDADTDLRRGDPLLLTGLLRAIAPTGVPIVLLHNYPFHRNAGYLAQVFPNVHVDVSLATHGVGQRASTVIAELLELAPFGKVLYASDAFALAELYYLGSALFRRGLASLLEDGVREGAWTYADAGRAARLITSANARRVYGT
ncbi:amidohydrolase family protein [Spirillospora albida]|uniref:amidohydrolase family protein n=1 Tax=Spirillospora albida TaxID=58123 RepID=UPI0004C078FB|nr:amidohydrolase family protein [Spirillospora albida]